VPGVRALRAIPYRQADRTARRRFRAAVPAGTSRGGLSATALGLDLPAMRCPDHEAAACINRI
jgi:hypothetical protein